MLIKHQTANGDVLLVSEMSDEHLANTLRQQARGLRTLYALAQNRAVASPYLRKLYGFQEMNEETAASLIREAISRMYPYLAEAWFRGLQFPDVHDALAEVMGREGQLDLVIHPILPEQVED